jgi:hypothetical protein
LTAYHYENMDNIWGQWQNTDTGEPSAFAVRGSTGNLTIYVYPIPDENGTLKVFYAGLPTAIAEDTSGDAGTNPIPDGWIDILIDYVVMKAQRRDNDPRWKEAKAVFDENLLELGDHDHLAIAREVVHDPRWGSQPRWLVDPSYDW